MAITNSIAGIKAGAKYVNTTINGLGERAGNAAFEELVMALKYIEGIDLGFNTKKFRGLSEYAAIASDRSIPTWKSIVRAFLPLMRKSCLCCVEEIAKRFNNLIKIYLCSVINNYKKSVSGFNYFFDFLGYVPAFLK